MTGAIDAPRFELGVPCWSTARGVWQVCCYGRGAASRADGLAPDRARAWLEQVHGAGVVLARPGDCGAADALMLETGREAAVIATADCLPVALLGARRAALAHAGWRGLAAGILGRALESLDEPASEVTAWIGPAIGPCCYEVGDEVARAVLPSSTTLPMEARGGLGRSMVDLPAAAAAQLHAAGVSEIASVGTCTRCHPQWLWSHRGQGTHAGRNWTVLWRE